MEPEKTEILIPESDISGLEMENKNDLMRVLSLVFMVLVILSVIALGTLKFIFGYNIGFTNSQMATEVPSPSIITSPAVGVNIETSLSTNSSDLLVTTAPLDEKWSTYKNTVKKFKINLPKQVYIDRGSCVDGKISDGLVPLKVSELGEDSYVTTDFFYDLRGDECNLLVNNSLGIINRLQAISNGVDTYLPNYWKITITKAESESDLLSYVKSKYGTGCSLGEMTKIDEDTYSVKIEGDGLDLGTTACPINFLAVLRYSPNLKILANWDAGQGISFAGENYIPAYDPTIIESFRFIR